MCISVRSFIYLPSMLRLLIPAVEPEATEHFLKLGKATLQAFPLLHARKASHSIMRQYANSVYHYINYGSFNIERESIL